MKHFLKRSLQGCVALFIALVVAGCVALFVPVEYNLTQQNQYPTLPDGCESVSASVALNGKGVYISAEDFAANYLPKAEFGTATPDEAYLGNPFGNGYYCYQKPLAEGINSFLATQNTTLKAKTHSLVPLSEVLLRLHKDGPVIVWGTVDDEIGKRETNVSWTIDGQEYYAYYNLHVMVIDGVKGGKLHLVDSINGARWISVLDFLPTYYSMGLRAVFLVD